jgi:hypothetical protein
MFFIKNPQYCCEDCAYFVDDPKRSMFSINNKGYCTYYLQPSNVRGISGAELLYLSYPERYRDASDCDKFEAK